MGNWTFEKEGIFVSAEESVVTIRVNKPETKNGTDWRALYALSEAYEKIGKDDELRVIVLRGNGEYFYTGGRVNPNDPEDSKMYAKAISESGKAKSSINLPVIAAVDGHCLKAGMGWLISADLAIARNDVTFAFPEVRMGGVPMMVMAEVMDYMPQKLAMEAFITCWNFSAEDAYRIGLVNRIVDESEFDATVQKYVDVYLNTPAELIRLTKKAYREMSKLSTLDERTSFAMEMLRNEVLPAMKTIKQEYNV